MPATIATSNIGDSEKEKNLRARIEEFFDQFPEDWRVSILGAQHNTVWELTVTAPNGRKEWVHRLHGEDGGHNMETIMIDLKKITSGMSPKVAC